MSAAVKRMMEIEGFTFMEVISPCPPTFGEYNAYPEALDMMQYFRSKAVVDHNADLRTVSVSARPEDDLVVGNFVDSRRESYQELLDSLRRRALERRK